MNPSSAGLALRRSLTSNYSSSSFASTSRFTLDHSSPPFDHLLPPPERLPFTRGRRSRRKTHANRLSLALALDQPERLGSAPAPRPRSDPTQVSPYLPEITREKNYLLSQFRATLHSNSRRRTPSSNRIDETWIKFVNVLRYPHEQLPHLPRSHFPLSTRSPQTLVHEPPPPSSSSSSFPLRPTGTFDPSFPTLPHPSPSRSTHDEQGGGAIGTRNRIEFTLAELHATFRIFASQRPRTRTNLHRLLILVELISRHRTNTPSSSSSCSPRHHDQEGFVVDDEIGGGGGGVGGGGGGERGGGEGKLSGNGRGLNDREWSQLMGFVGTNLRSTRPDPDTKSVLTLFAQREREQESSSERERQRRLEKTKSQTTETKTNGRKKSIERRRTSTKEETRLYNGLLHVAQRSRMWELFDQVLERMEERRIRQDGATFLARIAREDQRSPSSIEGVWRWFEKGWRWTMLEPRENGLGKRTRKETRKVLCNFFVWILAKRGDFDAADKVYRAMRRGETVNLEELRPVDDSQVWSYQPRRSNVDFIDPAPLPPPPPSTSTAPLPVRLPSPDHRLYSSLVQAYAHHGQLQSALLIMYEMINSSYPPTPQHFHSLFRSFVRFGGGTGGGGGEGVSDSLDWVTLSGIKSDTNRPSSSSSTSPLASILSPSTSSPRSRIARSGGGGGEAGTEFTLSALSTIFESFLSLSPPPPLSTRSPSTTALLLPFDGQRTAPSPQTVYFVLESFEKFLPGGGGGTGRNSQVLLQIYAKMEEKFSTATSLRGKEGGGKRARGEKGTNEDEGWTGWRMDKRVKRLVHGYKVRVYENEQRLKELM